MSTFMANKANIERKWYILDAAGKPRGPRPLSGLPTCCRGKTKPTFTPTPTAVTMSSSSTPARLC